MRRKEKEITDREWIDDIIRSSLVCRLAMSRDNIPYLLPLSFGYDGNALYFHTALEGTKIAYLNSGNPVCFEFERNVEIRTHPDIPCRWSCHYESVIGYGIVQELTECDQKQLALNEIMRQYSGRDWSFDLESVSKVRAWTVRITSISAKKSPVKQD